MMDWVRRGAEGETRFDAEGRRIAAEDRRETVRYQAVATPEGPVRLEVEPTGR